MFLPKRVREGAQFPATPARAGVLTLRRLTIAVVAAGLLAALAFSAAPAGAKIVTDPALHRNFGIFPSTNHVARNKSAITTACNAQNTDCGVLNYHNGPVQHNEKVYLLFWTPTGHPAPYAYRTALNQWLSDIVSEDYQAAGPISVTQQYFDLTGPSGAKNFVSYGVTNGGTLIDTDPYPSQNPAPCTDTDAFANPIPICITDTQIQTEVASYVHAHSLPTGLGVQYYVMTPANVGSCFDSSSSQCSYNTYCGYHNNFTNGANQTILYADMPWAFNVNGCDVNLAFGAGYANADAIDPVVGIFSHELSETMTDPVVSPNATGWWQNSGTDAGMEIGDKCAYIYGSGGVGSLAGLSNNGMGYYNYTFGGNQYLAQWEFSNAPANNPNCVVRNTGSPQPAFTVSPTTASHGTPRTFTATVTDSNGVQYLDWDFGDGTTARTAGTACTGSGPFSCQNSHTYSTSGSKLLRIVVTDKQGNQKRVGATIVVN
jgi:hypothetical protein